ncbi:MAG TPA: type III-B CRISPR module RAMP protein Cmr4, partial [Acidobacteriota bacterium]|nr:type III-B CRISPR module RAMP protein Cmr4 [Acidobacteriota bacterium]
GVIAQDAQTLLVEKGIYLEDLDLTPKPDADAKKWAEWIGQQVFSDPDEANWRTMLTERLCIVHDDILSFLLETATEVTARIKLDDDKKTVTQGALWYEEALPAETILSGVVVATPTKEIEKTIKAPELFIDLNRLIVSPLQFGGKATVGRGLCRVHLS